jgi:UDP-2,3-diacylglucosamine pyrophosphatase LpxH
VQKDYRTIVLSDIHLGSKWSKTREATRFLRKNSCRTLILCGDIIDGWAILRGKKAKWKRRHTNFIKTVLELSLTTRIVYVRGNHDDFLDRLIPVDFPGISIVRDWIYTVGDKRYYVLHGDIFDRVTSSMRWLAKAGDVGYSMLLWINRVYNRRRIKKGLPYYSIAGEIKRKVKASVSYISDFEEHVVAIARRKECDGVICGHIHHPEIRTIAGIEYLNAGDWIESLSALTEDFDGRWSIHRVEQAAGQTVAAKADAEITPEIAVA